MDVRRVLWHQAKTRLESGKLTPLPPGFHNESIEHVFKATADFCLVRSLAESRPPVTRADVQNEQSQSERFGNGLSAHPSPLQPAGGGPSPILHPPVEPASAETARQARAKTVAKLIKELDRLKPQMLEDEAEYDRLREQYPTYLAFKSPKTGQTSNSRFFP